MEKTFHTDYNSLTHTKASRLQAFGKSSSTLAMGRKIAAIRRAKKMSSEQLAHLAGITLDELLQFEDGWRHPSRDVLLKLTEGLRVDVSEFR